MGRILRDMALFTAGAGAAYLFDPISGRKRRADLIAQTGSRMRRAQSSVDAKARYQSGKARGWFFETFVPQEPPANDRELLQKVRSEAVGPTRGRVDYVDIHIEDGVVHLVGESRDPAVEAELAERIAAVTGVDEVRNELVPAS